MPWVIFRYKIHRTLKFIMAKFYINILTLGELFIILEDSNKSVVFVLLAANPHFRYATSVFQDLVSSAYSQYIFKINNFKNNLT